jgi:hypothetical protein
VTNAKIRDGTGTVRLRAHLARRLNDRELLMRKPQVREVSFSFVFTSAHSVPQSKYTCSESATHKTCA